MENILEAADKLAECILQSEEYKLFTRFKNIIEINPGLKSKLDSFYIASNNHEMKRIRGETIPFDEERIISNKYTELWLNEETRAYMGAKNNLLITLEKIYGVIEAKCTV